MGWPRATAEPVCNLVRTEWYSWSPENLRGAKLFALESACRGDLLVKGAACLGLLLGLLGACGCAGMEGSVGALPLGWRQEPALLREVPVSRPEAYAALRAAAIRLGYRVVRSSPTPGILEFVGPVRSGSAPGSSSQIIARARVKSQPSGAEVSLALAEVREADSSRRAGHATEVPLPPGPRHEALLAELGRELAAQKSR